MKTNKSSQQQSETKQANDNPLANIAGKFGGEFWLATQSEIERSRQQDLEEISKLQDNKSNQQDQQN